MIRRACLIAVLAICPAIAFLYAEIGYDAWLRYTPVTPAAKRLYARLPAAIFTSHESPVLESARQELERGVHGMLGKIMQVKPRIAAGDAIILATFDTLPAIAPSLTPPSSPVKESYLLKTLELNGHSILIIAAPDDRGVLYGVFALLRHIALGLAIDNLDESGTPYAPVRWTNEWNNLDGTIERGYAGRSIFFANGHVIRNLTRGRDYARLLASIGINGCTVNSVNADPRTLTSEFVPELARIAAAFRPWGVRMSIAVDFSSPKTVGALDTFDPLDSRVAAWWRQKADEVYRAIPDLAGFVLKADSEGRLGPSAYGRTHADAANVVARALKPHGGILLYRAFVYDHHMDWRNPKNDRARAAYDNFYPLDGQFEDNVILQIKHGPSDFQVREPVSPLLGALARTNEAIELQITQEYTGQQRHLCYLAPMWKEALDFDLHAAGRSTPVKDLVSGLAFRRPTGGFIGVANVGLDANWLGHDLAMANLYGFGRLAWNPNLSARDIAQDWTRQTFGHDAHVVDTIVSLLMESWPAYEAYTGPLGAGTLTDITHAHYGPGIESSERNGWGQWHHAGADGFGMDRTVATGTGFIGQYAPSLARMYESRAHCPDGLVLFMHHVPWTHVLHSDKTVIQHIYDSHYDGAARTKTFPERWRELKGRIDEPRYQAVLAKLEYQAGHAIVWRDAICDWFLRTSGIPDAHGRVGNHPGRVEAESMTLDGYAVEPVTPWETASGGKAIGCFQPACSASFHFQGTPGPYEIAVQYFDERDGTSVYKLFVAGQDVAEWLANDDLPSDQPNGHTSTRKTVKGIRLRSGDEIRIKATTAAKDHADVDYVEITPPHGAHP
ncbi:MAG TPA: alpha-glucuronidase family glycosyl hydrolase [Bryobacteraceae bacterium]|nr:alpha-glucuronidase family glycosyl hydrolase [Bryobacteraceae bacterium]